MYPIACSRETISCLVSQNCATGYRDVDSPRARRGSNTNASKLGSSAVFPSFVGMAAAGNSAVPAGLDRLSSNAAMLSSFDRPMTAASPLGMTNSGASDVTAGMTSMLGQTMRPNTAAVQSASGPSGGL